jgi:hypothetical protein
VLPIFALPVARWTQQGIICRELALKAWRWPAVEHPQAENPYPEGSVAAASWRPDMEARALWRLLDEAANRSPNVAHGDISEPRRGLGSEHAEVAPEPTPWPD